MKLLEELAALTGLPNDLVLTHFKNLLEESGRPADSIDLETIREFLAGHLQDVLLDVKNEFEGSTR